MTATLTSPEALLAANPALATGLLTPASGAVEPLAGRTADAQNPHGAFASVLRSAQTQAPPSNPINAPSPGISPAPVQPASSTSTAFNPAHPNSLLGGRQIIAGQHLPPDGTTLPPPGSSISSVAGATGAATGEPSLEIPANLFSERTRVLPEGEITVVPPSGDDVVIPLHGAVTGEFDQPPTIQRGVANLSTLATGTSDKSLAANMQTGTQPDQRQSQPPSPNLAQSNPIPTLVEESVQRVGHSQAAGFSTPIESSAANTQPGLIGNEIRAFSDALPELREFTRPLQPMADAQRWSNGLSERLLMMAETGTQTARIKLHPAHLGPLDVQVTVEEDTARVWFGAQHAQTREALEAALPRLREMLAGQGLELIQTDIDAGHKRNDQDGVVAHGREFSEPDVDGNTIAGADDDTTAQRKISLRLVDTYA